MAYRSRDSPAGAKHSAGNPALLFTGRRKDMADKCILNPNTECLGLMKAEELANDIAEMRARNDLSHKEFFSRLAILEAHDQVQDVHYEHILEKLTGINETLSGVSSRIAAIETKPAKRWEGIVEKIILLVVAAGVGYILSKVGL